MLPLNGVASIFWLEELKKREFNELREFRVYLNYINTKYLKLPKLLKFLNPKLLLPAPPKFIVKSCEMWC